ARTRGFERDRRAVRVRVDEVAVKASRRSRPGTSGEPGATSSVPAKTNGKSKVTSRHDTSLPRILVVEANPAYRAVISNVVEIAGGQFESIAEVESARSPRGRQKAFDLVIIGTSAEAPITPAQVVKLRAKVQTPLIVMAEAYDETKSALDGYQAG